MKHIYLLFIGLCGFMATTYAQTSRSLSSSNIIAREDEYDVKFYFLDLDLETSSTTISGNVLISAVSQVSALDTFALELSNVFTVDSAKASLNGGAFQNATTTTEEPSGLDVLLPFTAGSGQPVSVRVYYHGTTTASVLTPTGSGFFESKDFGYPGYQAFIYSASPPYNSSTWWPCKQNLDDKADSVWFFITTSNANSAMSNGQLYQQVTVPGNKVQYQWKIHDPIDFYLISFNVGPYLGYTEYYHPAGRTDSMPITVYNLNNNYGPSPSQIMSLFNLYFPRFGPYPFYSNGIGYVMVDLSGGMENQTMIELGGLDYMGLTLWSMDDVAHETMHQWFGDNVTCASYRDLFVNEGFARWSESLYNELTADSPTTGNEARMAYCNMYEQGALDEPSGSVYGYNGDTGSIDGLYAGAAYNLIYDKGAMLINSMRFEVNNDSLFYLGLRNYQTRFSGRTAYGSDVRDVMSATTGIDFTDFFNQWYYGFGFPTFNILWNEENNRLEMRITETTSDSSTPLFKTSLQVRAKNAIGDSTDLRMFISANVSDFNLPVSFSGITGLGVDPNQWILNAPGTVTLDTSLHIPVTSGLPEINTGAAAINIFPNPATGWLELTPTGFTPQSLIIWNGSGQRMSEQKFTTRLNITALPAGVYFIEVKNETITMRNRVVKM